MEETYDISDVVFIAHVVIYVVICCWLNACLLMHLLLGLPRLTALPGPRDTKAGKNASRKSVLRAQQEKTSDWDERVCQPKLGFKVQGFKHLKWLRYALFYWNCV